MNRIIFTLVFLSCLFPSAGSAEELHFIAKVLNNGQKIQIIQEGKHFIFPVEVSSDVEAMINQLHPEDDAVIDGHIRYQRTVTHDGEAFNTYFVVDSVRPVSLQRLRPTGIMDSSRRTDLLPLQKAYRPLTIPVSSGVATALTMTVTGLLLNDLAAPISEAPLRNQSNGIVLIGAGVLITGALIYDQIFSQLSTKDQE